MEDGEIALEGKIVGVDALKNEVQLDATAFQSREGKRQTFPKAKPKTLLLSPKTQLFDERTEAAATLRDLKIGATIRATGRDGGSGKPFALRLLRWSSTEVPDPDTPRPLVPLLPPSKTWKGVNVRVVDAGFKPRAQLFPGANMAPQQITWMMAVRGVSSDAVRFVGLQTPEGFIEHANGQAGWPLSDGTSANAFEFAEVKPMWKSVRARFEVAAPGAPTDTRGEMSGEIPVEIPVPSETNGVLEPHTKWKTPRGATIELARVEAVDATKRLKIFWKWTPPKDAPDAHIFFNLGSLKTGDEPIYGAGMSVGGNDGQRGRVEEEIGILPRGKTLSGNLLVHGFAPSWRKSEFLHTIEFELPVAATIAALPPKLLENRPAPIEIQTTGGIARLEAPHAEGPYQVFPLWLSPTPNDKPAKNGIEERLLLREVRVQKPDGNQTKSNYWGHDGNTFWHDDLAFARSDETGWRLMLSPEEAAATMQITATAQRTQIFQGDHSAQNIPTPARGQTRDLGEDFGDDVVSVRKIAWVEPNHWKDTPFVRDNLRFKIGPHGAFVVVCELLRVWPEGTRDFRDLTISNDKGAIYSSADTSMWGGDLLESGAMSPTIVSFLVQASPEDVKGLNLAFHLRELSPGQSQTFVFPKVELSP